MDDEGNEYKEYLRNKALSRHSRLCRESMFRYSVRMKTDWTHCSYAFAGENVGDYLNA
jgi:hypothetical protein